jgi:putative transcription factor
MSHQDWNEVVWNKRAPTGANAKDPKVVNEARRRGDAIEVAAKKSATNTNHSIPGSKFDTDEGDYRHAHVSHEFKKELQKARMAKGLTQVQLAAAICEQKSVINDYESGKAIPDGKIIQKLNRFFGITFPKAK